MKQDEEGCGMMWRGGGGSRGVREDMEGVGKTEEGVGRCETVKAEVEGYRKILLKQEPHSRLDI